MLTKEELRDIQRQQLLENQEQLLKNQEALLGREYFLERLMDNMLLATCFFSLGVLTCTLILFYVFKYRARIDYELDDGTIMRVHGKKGRKHLIVKPVNLMQLYDIVLLSFFDKGKKRFIDTHDKKRIRRISGVVFTVIILASLFGINEIIGVVEIDVNPASKVMEYIKQFSN